MNINIQTGQILSYTNIQNILTNEINKLDNIKNIMTRFDQKGYCQ